MSRNNKILQCIRIFIAQKCILLRKIGLCYLINFRIDLSFAMLLVTVELTSDFRTKLEPCVSTGLILGHQSSQLTDKQE